MKKIGVLQHHYDLAHQLAKFEGDPLSIAKLAVTEGDLRDPRYNIRSEKTFMRYAFGFKELIELARRNELEPIAEIDEKGELIPLPGDFFCRDYCIASMPSRPWREVDRNGREGIGFCPKAKWEIDRLIKKVVTMNKIQADFMASMPKVEVVLFRRDK